MEIGTLMMTLVYWVAGFVGLLILVGVGYVFWLRSNQMKGM